MEAVIDIESDPGAHTQMQQAHLQFLEEALMLVTDIKRRLSVAREAKALSGSVEFWQALLGRAYDGLVKVNSLLSIADFTRVIVGLLGHADPALRLRALHLLAERVARASAAPAAVAHRDIAMLAGLAAPLNAVLTSPPASEAAQDVRMNNRGLDLMLE